ncbi:hypothetical protein PENSPDRAFT_590392 [Peniophora sp. CONT]|nr:hypothetical protein PENSPDRAFT_590392 [Peniophora sp. CONT]
MSRGSRAPRKHFPIDIRDTTVLYYSFASTTLEKVAPYKLYDYQLEGTLIAGSGVDLLGVVPTGGGKTVFFTLPIQLLCAIASSTTVDPDVRKHYPRNPVMLVIMPTNSLSMEKELDFNKLSGLRAVTINADAVDRARREGRASPWSVARDPSTTHILLSPEQLITASYEELHKDKEFISRVLILGVDEIHLLDTLGTSFRKIMLQISFMRSRLPSHVVFIATTATLLAGARTRNILNFLGLRVGHFHKIHRSNIRHDVQLIVRPLSTSIASRRFPDLLWVPQKRRRCIISQHLQLHVRAPILVLAPFNPSCKHRCAARARQSRPILHYWTFPLSNSPSTERLRAIALSQRLGRAHA